MARNKLIEERVKVLVAELLAEEAAEGLNVKDENINDIEEAMVRIGDLVAREFGVQKLAAHMSQPPEAPPCPRCGHAGEHQGERTRKAITRRGEVPDGSQVPLSKMPAAFFPLRPPHWGLKPTTITRQRCIAGLCSPRRRGSVSRTLPKR